MAQFGLDTLLKLFADNETAIAELALPRTRPEQGPAQELEATDQGATVLNKFKMQLAKEILEKDRSIRELRQSLGMSAAADGKTATRVEMTMKQVELDVRLAQFKTNKTAIADLIVRRGKALQSPDPNVKGNSI
jgi:hypothetical protein